ncbi:MAG TPA: Fic family protein [Candidatus Nanoarchaeia archaeon]|nr:Fic family protein [Candidatus Nanoarchaeia archaeon]
MHIIEEKLLLDIESAKSRLDRKRLDDFVREMFKCLSRETMENATIQDADNARRKSEVFANFEIAWDYGTRNFKEPVDFAYLGDVAGRVEPGLCAPGQHYASFRNGSATCFAGYLPPADESRVREHLARSLDVLESQDWHPIEKAVFLNFHITRIQPFQNGNKRTANIVTNATLKNNDFFPISISQKNKSRYQGYLAGALKDFENMGATVDDPLQPYKFPGFGQRQFYDFLARIELSELKCAEDKLSGLSHYTLSFNNAPINTLYGVKHHVRNWLQGHNMLHQVRLDVARKEITVAGDIPLHSLEIAVGKIKGIGKYEIKPYKPANGSSGPFSV